MACDLNEIFERVKKSEEDAAIEAEKLVCYKLNCLCGKRHDTPHDYHEMTEGF